MSVKGHWGSKNPKNWKFVSAYAGNIIISWLRHWLQVIYMITLSNRNEENIQGREEQQRQIPSFFSDLLKYHRCSDEANNHAKLDIVTVIVHRHQVILPDSELFTSKSILIQTFVAIRGESSLDVRQPAQHALFWVNDLIASQKVKCLAMIVSHPFAIAQVCNSGTLCVKGHLSDPPKGYINRSSRTEVGLTHLGAPNFPNIVGLVSLLSPYHDETSVRWPA